MPMTKTGQRKKLLESWVDAGWDRADARSWVDAGFAQPTDAEEWKGRYRPWLAAEWVNAGCDVPEADASDSLGFNVSDVLSVKQAGLVQSQVAQLIADGMDSWDVMRVLEVLGAATLRSERWLPVIKKHGGLVAMLAKEGFSMQEIEMWLAKGFLGYEISAIVESGASIDSALSLHSAGLPKGTVGGRSLVAAAVTAGISPDEAKRWVALRLSPDVLFTMFQRHADIRIVESLLGKQVPPEHLTDLPLCGLTSSAAFLWSELELRGKAVLYFEAGVRDPAVARRWAEAGFAPNAIRGFADRGVEPELVLG